MTVEGQSVLEVLFGSLKCRQPFDCTQDLDSHVGIVLWLMIMLYMFKQLGTICDEYFVPALEVIVERLEMSNDVAGATFMAAGSSAPELFTSLVATFLIVNEGGVGTIVGSAIFNILVIVGVTGFVACKDQSLPIWWYPLARDCVFYSISIAELFIVLWDEEVRWYEGTLMIVTYLAYCFYMKINHSVIERFNLTCQEPGMNEEGSHEVIEDVSSWQDPVQEVKVGSVEDRLESDREKSPEVTPEAYSAKCSDNKIGINVDVVQMVKLSSLPNAVPGTCPSPLPGSGDVLAFHQQTSRERLSVEEQSSSHQHAKWSTATVRESQHSNALTNLPVVPDGKTDVVAVVNKDEDHGTTPASDEEETASWRRYCRDPLEVALELVMPSAHKNHWLLFGMAIFFIGAATYLMVDATNRIGIILTVPPQVMGLTFLAAGTSIPDAMGSIAVAKQGEGDMAVANALGSNVFDILVGLGVPWTIRCISSGPVDFSGKSDSLGSDIVILAVILAVFIGSLLINTWQLTRRVGMVFVSFYACFIIYNILAVFVFKFKKSEEH